jgi:hypothetical protein
MKLDEPALHGIGNWIPHRYDSERDLLHFALTTREERLRLPFLSAADLANFPHDVKTRLPFDRGPDGPPTHFIFHSAYCGSTLLANFLDIEGAAMSLKEPQILNDLVGWRRRGGQTAQVRCVMDQVLALLSSVGDGQDAVIIKPSNVCNEQIEALLEVRPLSRAIFLYSPLPVYLGSLARKGFWARRWARELLVRQLENGLPRFGFTESDHIQHTDLEAAAVGWLTQMVQFVALAKRHPQRIAMLESEMFLGHPEEATIAALQHFQVGVAASKVTLAVKERIGLNSKDGKPFDRSQQALLRQSLVDSNGNEIAMVTEWAERVAKGAGLDIQPRSELNLSRSGMTKLRQNQ